MGSPEIITPFILIVYSRVDLRASVVVNCILALAVVQFIEILVLVKTLGIPRPVIIKPCNHCAI